MARHGAIPASPVADRDLGKTIVIRLDATLVIAHSDKEQAAGTFKGSFGHHPLTAWCDNTGENLAVKLRTGSAGSNTITDHLEVLTAAIAQIPASSRRDLLITCDGAGATKDLLAHITTLNAVPGRRVHYSVGSTWTPVPAPPSTACRRRCGTTSSTLTAHPATPATPGSWS